MNILKRVTAALMASLVIVTTTYNVYTVNVYATGVAIGEVIGWILTQLAISYGVIYMGEQALDIPSDTYMDRITSFCLTPEGYNALLDLEIKPADSSKSVNIGEKFGLDHMVGGSNQSPDPKDVQKILQQVAAGVVVGGSLAVFLSRFFDHETASSSGSAIGAAINEASNQEITVISPFPEYMHFTSVAERLHDDSMDDRFKSYYPEYDLANSYFVQNVSGPFYHIILVPEDLESAGIASLSLIQSYNQDDFHFVAYDSAGNKVQLSRYNTYVLNVNNHSKFDGDNLSVGGYLVDLYVCGDMDIYMGRNSEFHYHLYPDGTVVQVVDGQPDQDVKPYLQTALGKLTSVRPIVNMDISALIDAIGQAIADAHPDEVPSLSPEALAAILSGVAGVYNDAVTNYYNDTSYIDQSQYITNITNVYEQAIADNPVIDIPDTDTGILSAIKAIPGQIAKVVADIFIPDLAMMKGHLGSIMNHFSWMREPWDFFRALIDMIFVDNNDPPVIYIDLSKAESSYIYGGKTVLIDFAFWERYKPLADTIIVGFCYIWFAYWFFRNLPEIISGGSPVPVFRSSERAAARIQDAVLKSDSEYGRVKVNTYDGVYTSRNLSPLTNLSNERDYQDKRER